MPQSGKETGAATSGAATSGAATSGAATSSVNGKAACCQSSNKHHNLMIYFNGDKHAQFSSSTTEVISYRISLNGGESDGFYDGGGISTDHRSTTVCYTSSQ